MSTVDTSSNSAWAQSLASLNGALTSQLQEKTLRKMDADGSGGVDQGEFQVALEKLAGKLGVNVGEGSSALYGSLDANQDGSLDATEVGSLVQGVLGALAGAQDYVQSRGDEASFSAMDGNGDGVITREEYGLVSDGAQASSAADSNSGFSNIAATLLAAAIAGAIAGRHSGEAVADEGSGEEEAGAEAVADAGASEADQAASSESGTASSADAGHHTIHRNGDGRISHRELQEAVSRMQAHQAQAASIRYNDTLQAQTNGGQSRARHSRLNASA